MAYVRKTEKLVTEMRDQVRRMASKAVEPYKNGNVDSTHPLYASLKEATEKSAWDKAPELREKMPLEWCTVVDSAGIKVYDDAGKRLFTTYIQTRDDDRIKVPTTNRSSYYRYEAEVYPRHCSEALKQWISQQEAREVQLRVVQDQYHTIESQLMAFMSGQASLNSALKEMPELEMYVPHEFMVKYRQADEPREKKPRQNALLQDVGIDRDVFAAAAIAHRIATAAE